MRMRSSCPASTKDEWVPLLCFKTLKQHQRQQKSNHRLLPFPPRMRDGAEGDLVDEFLANVFRDANKLLGLSKIRLYRKVNKPARLCRHERSGTR